MSFIRHVRACMANLAITAEGTRSVTRRSGLRCANKVISNVLILPKGSNRELFENLRRVFVVKQHTEIAENDIPDRNVERMVCKNQRNSLGGSRFRWLKNRLSVKQLDTIKGILGGFLRITARMEESRHFFLNTKTVTGVTAYTLSPQELTVRDALFTSWRMRRVIHEITMRIRWLVMDGGTDPIVVDTELEIKEINTVLASEIKLTSRWFKFGNCA